MPAPLIFDPTRRRRLRARSARRFAGSDFLHRRAMADVVDRLETVTRDFPRALFIGAGDLAAMLTPECGVGAITAGDSALGRLGMHRPAALFDEEALPFAAESFDLIVSLLTLHAANDVVGALAQARAALKPDGLFIAALFGEETLGSFRAALYRAEAEASGGVSPRLFPFASVRDLGGALQRAGFALPVADVDPVEVRYADPRRLISDLRAIGETSALSARPKPLSRAVIGAALADFAATGGAARFDIVFLTGWAPHPAQQKPLAPGSARASLKDAVRKGGG